MAVTVTFAPGLAASKSFASAESFSPSVPMAQTVSSPVAVPVSTGLADSPELLPALRPHPTAASRVSTAMAAGNRPVLIGHLPGGCNRLHCPVRYSLSTSAASRLPSHGQIKAHGSRLVQGWSGLGPRAFRGSRGLSRLSAVFEKVG